MEVKGREDVNMADNEGARCWMETRNSISYSNLTAVDIFITHLLIISYIQNAQYCYYGPINYNHHHCISLDSIFFKYSVMTVMIITFVNMTTKFTHHLCVSM